MTVNLKELEYEKNRFKATKEWIKNELSKSYIKSEECSEKVQRLKKQSGGTYSIDLILVENSLDYIKKNIFKYEEASVNPYFARIDFKEKLRDKESFYIGKFGIVDDEDMKEIVVDWRAPVANLYYSGTFGKSSYKSPSGLIEGDLLLKRKFHVRDGEILKVFDEGINELIVPSTEDGNELVDEFLKLNLEENMSKKLKDVVTTIQKEQNDIIRAFKNKPIIIQGSAGSGKTTVALHRLAYLVYTYEEGMNSSILVVAPNELFLDYISDILPNLGVSNVSQITFEKLCRDITGIDYTLLSKEEKLSEIIESKDDEHIKYVKAISRIKGSITYKKMMDRLIRYLELKASETGNIMFDNEYVLFSAYEIKKLFLRDLSKLPINKRIDEINRYFSEKLKSRAEDVKKQIEDKYYFAVRDIKADGNLSEADKRQAIIKTYDERDAILKRLLSDSRRVLRGFFKGWKAVDAFEGYLSFMSDGEVYDKVTSGVIPERLKDYMRNEFLLLNKKKTIDLDDLSAIAYLSLKLNGSSKANYMHTVIDEAQDYSMLQFEVMKLISKNNSMTIVGDIGQEIYSYKGIDSWENLIADVFNKEASYVNLTQSYRSTIEIIEFAERVLKKQNLNIIPAKPILRHGPYPDVIEAVDDDYIEIDKAVKKIRDSGKNTIAVICRDGLECRNLYDSIEGRSHYNFELISDNDSNMDADLMIIPSYMSKGLEFDGCIIWNCDEKNYTNKDIDKKLLYVALTRALHMEYIIYRGKLSSLLEPI